MNEQNINQQPNRIPDFASIEEEAVFWDTHDTTDFEEEFHPVIVHFDKHLHANRYNRGIQRRQAIMSTTPRHISFDEFVSNTREILREIEKQGESVLIENGEHFFALTPKKVANHNTESHLSRSDGLFEIIGIGESEEPTDISVHKHDYIAQAALDHTQQ